MSLLANVGLGLLIKLKDGGTLSTIGSPNFGYRSETRDNELQFYLFSKNTNFNTDLRKVSSIILARLRLFIKFSHLKNFLSMGKESIE